MSLWLPFDDLGAGAVSTTPVAAAGSPTPIFTRATTATTVLSNGLIAGVSSGTPRSCYSPAGIYLGYLAEQASTNLALQSTFASGWNSDAVATAAGTASPDGTVAGVKVNELATSGTHALYQSFTKAGSALAYTFCVYVKQAERTWVALTLDDATVNNGVAAYFNLVTGAVGTISKDSIYTNQLSGATASITAAGNGFYRCILTATSTAGTSLNAAIRPVTGDAAGLSFAGVAGSGIYAWGAQLEQLGFATSYIPTTTTAVTRNADVLTYPTAGNADSTQGTAYAEVTTPLTGTSAELTFLGSVGAGTGPGLMYLNNATGNPLSLFDGTTERNFGPNANIPLTTPTKMAVKWSGAAANGAIGGTLGSATAFDGDAGIGATLHVGKDDTSLRYPNGTIKNIRIWTRALTDSQLASLTS